MAGTNLVEVIRSLQTYVQGLEARVARLQAQVDSGAPKADPTGSGAAAASAPGAPCQIFYGRVVEVLPFFGWYRVFPENGNAAINCCLGSDVAATPVGVRRVGALQPFSRVYYVRRRGVGVIIAAEPAYASAKDQAFPDWVANSSTNTPAAEQVSNALLQLKDHGIADFSNGGALDETAVGEWGRMAETGVMIFVDPFMAFVRADEMTGVWAFYHDQLTRVSGRSLQFRAAGREDEQLDDEGEFTREAGTTPYAWEGLGAMERGLTTAVSHTNAEAQKDAPHHTNLDVKEEFKQYPFFRSREYGGYLGQGYRRTVVLPPPEAAGKVNKLDDPLKLIGVFDEQVALDGTYTARSAQGWTAAHVPVFTVPNRKKRSEDETGDGAATGYRPGGDDHKPADNPPAPTGAPQIPARCLAADDDLAFSGQWRGDHPFWYHKQDFDLPDEIPDHDERVPTFATLADDWYLEPPAPKDKKVDHRYTAKVRQLVSMFKLLPDGGVVIAGGCGEEIRLAGGTVKISAPGDALVEAGRNAVVMAGRDAVVKGHDNAELSASKKDVRIKGEVNTQITAGNSGRGVLLLESRSAVRDQNFAKVGTDVDAGGVLVRAKKGVFAVLADEVYVRSGADSGAGPIVLDAAKGASPVVVQAQAAVNLVRTMVVDAFGREGDYAQANLYTPATTTVAGNLESNGRLVVKGAGIFGQTLYVSGGHVATSDAETYNSQVAVLKDDGLEKAKEAVEAVEDTVADTRQRAAAVYTSAVDTPFYQGLRVGGDEAVRRVEFSCRTSAQAKTEDMVLFESRWQQRARLAGQQTETWDEPVVKTAAEDTQPWPGRAAWEELSTFRTVDLLLYDVAAGTPKPRGAAYENPQPPAAAAATPAGNYRIVK